MTAIDEGADRTELEPLSTRLTGQIRLSEVANSRLNNFDSLRLIAAVLVMVDHAFPLLGHAHVFEDRIGTTLGGIAVSSFFAMSGFLITKSWLDDPNPFRFTVKRGLRLMPALIVAVFFCALVIGPIATTLSWGDYLRAPQTWSYIKHNAAVFPILYNLPGVFADNPYPTAVNGSIWSLPVEVLAYGVVLVLGVTSLLRRRQVVVGLLVFTLYVNWHLISNGWLGSGIWFYMPTVQIWDLLSIFLIGSLYYLYRERIVLSWKIALGLVVLYALSVNTAHIGLVFYLLIPYLLFTAAYTPLPRLRALARPGDVSYGVYIYAFPIQQLFAHVWPTANPWLSLFVTVPVTYAIAFASWRIIEKPSLRLKRLFARKPSIVVKPSPRVEPAE